MPILQVQCEAAFHPTIYLLFIYFLLYLFVKRKKRLKGRTLYTHYYKAIKREYTKSMKGPLYTYLDWYKKEGSRNFPSVLKNSQCPEKFYNLFLAHIPQVKKDIKCQMTSNKLLGQRGSQLYMRLTT